MKVKKKILIIRFSSFGDIIQSMGTLPALKRAGYEIHFLTKNQFIGLVEASELIDHVYSIDQSVGIRGLFSLANKICGLKFDVIYDAHKNLRTLFLRPWLRLFSGAKVLVRPKFRIKRFLLFSMRKNYFPKPFRGIHSYQQPLVDEGLISEDVDHIQRLNFSGHQKFEQRVVLAPSAAWEMKRWPLSYWKELILLMPQEKFYVLGGPDDDFCQELEEIAPDRVINLQGQLSLLESCQVVSQGQCLICADTGLLHVADILKVPAIALIGPTAFGFPTGEFIKVAQVDLPCRPCTKDGRGKCSQSVYQKCLVDITPKRVRDIFLDLG